tara:strand:+ start:1746 stop:2060 length:315 start_codon:yes stop_codon:yes gene_type:complete
MEASATLALVISNIHSAILKVTSKLEWAVGQIKDNQRRLNSLTGLTTVSSEANRLAIEKLRAMLNQPYSEIERLIREVTALKAEVEALKPTTGEQLDDALKEKE